eukprot:GHVS01022971.1.p1 GENE.GHVS01022971.1~~GHVS01022971.1.p1  ORF type:complete len:767 (-),score=121.98 GHVS01022971.1:586-2808(-)
MLPQDGMPHSLHQASGNLLLPNISVMSTGFGSDIVPTNGREPFSCVGSAGVGVEVSHSVPFEGLDTTVDLAIGRGDGSLTTGVCSEHNCRVEVVVDERSQTSVAPTRMETVSDVPKTLGGVGGQPAAVGNPKRRMLLECDSLLKLLSCFFSEIRQDILDRLVAKLDSGELPAVSSWTLQPPAVGASSTDSSAARAAASSPPSQSPKTSASTSGSRPGPICEPIAHDVMIVLSETIRDVLQDVWNCLEKRAHPSGGAAVAPLASGGGTCAKLETASVAESSSTLQKRKRGRPRSQSALPDAADTYEERGQECVWGATLNHEDCVAEDVDEVLPVERKRGGGRAKWSRSRRGIRCLMPTGPVAVLNDGPPLVMISKEYDRLPVALQEKYMHTVKQSRVLQSLLTSLRRYDRTMEVWVDEEGRCINPVPSEVFGVSSRVRRNTCGKTASDERDSNGSKHEDAKEEDEAQSRTDKAEDVQDEEGQEEDEGCDDDVGKSSGGAELPYEAYRYVSCVMAVRRKQASRAYRFEPQSSDVANSGDNEEVDKKGKRRRGGDGEATPNYWYEYKVKWCISKQEDTWELQENLPGLTERLSQLRRVYNRQRIRLERLMAVLDKVAKVNSDKPTSPEPPATPSASRARVGACDYPLDDSTHLRCSVVISPVTSPLRRRSRGGGGLSAKRSATSTDDGTSSRRGRGRAGGGRGGGTEKLGRRGKDQDDEEEEEVGKSGSQVPPTLISASDFLS